ncbi:MAG: class A beta-lactamase, subclass A2 [Ignavibacteriaceae bacterium]|nr:class A beta-lactamase, subclass A2 [Ignavibacteriaceae bacterium]
MKNIITLVFLLLLQGSYLYSQTSLLKNEMEKIVTGKNAKVGVSVSGGDSEETLTLNGEVRFPMQSVFKFHIALAVMAEVDKGSLSPEQLMGIKKDELMTDTWSPMRDKYPEGGILTLGEIIRYTIAVSDNNGCDILLRLIGGPEAVTSFLKSKGLTGFAIVYDEAEMHQNYENQFANWSTPESATYLLRLFNENKLILPESTEYLRQIMRETSTGMKRIKGMLPEGTVVAHKTGSSGRDENGIATATNDIGIVWLPDGRFFYISVFVADSKETDEMNERIIADLSKAAYDYFVK